MSNPWLTVPLADYEGHMQADGIHQLEPLSQLFGKVLAYCKPASVVIMGIAGGNGLEHIDTDVTNRVVGIDINGAYLDEVRKRYTRLKGLQLFCIDLAEEIVDLETAQLVHVALVFEHAGVGRCLENALSLVAPGGFLSVVLQLPSEQTPTVSPSGFATLQNLAPHFSLVDVKWLRETLEQRQFKTEDQTELSLPAGKGLWMGIFRRL